MEKSVIADSAIITEYNEPHAWNKTIISYNCFERIKRRYSQEKLAELARIGHSTLTQIEAQTSSPTLDVVEKLANVLEFEPYELLIFKNLEI